MVHQLDNETQIILLSLGNTEALNKTSTMFDVGFKKFNAV